MNTTTKTETDFPVGAVVKITEMSGQILWIGVIVGECHDPHLGRKVLVQWTWSRRRLKISKVTAERGSHGWWRIESNPGERRLLERA